MNFAVYANQEKIIKGRRQIEAIAVVCTVSICSFEAGRFWQEQTHPLQTIPAVAAETTAVPYLPQEADLPEKDTENVLLLDLPEYEGEPATIIFNNKPDFTEEDKESLTYEAYGSLDQYGRASWGMAVLGQKLMPHEERESISEVTPSGWHNESYSFVEGGWVYNRCHLIGYQLTGENANERNLITGTRYMNTEGFIPYENLIASYLMETGNHVVLRVTPVYKGSELIARGVQLEAQSIEDDGDGIEFNVYCHNVQPGVSIDYSSGYIKADETLPEETEAENDSEEKKENTEEPEEKTDECQKAAASQTAAAKEQESPEAVSQKERAASAAPPSQPENPAPQPAPEPVQEYTAPVNTVTYIANSNTGKFHRPGCRAVKQMNEVHKVFFYADRSEPAGYGYIPCKICNP